MGRSYRVVGFDPQENRVTFEGEVRASWFLAIFLSFLAAIGFLCVALVLATLIPSLSQGIIALVFLSPLAGAFYWQQANRREQVLVTVSEEEKNFPQAQCRGKSGYNYRAPGRVGRSKTSYARTPAEPVDGVAPREHTELHNLRRRC